MSHTPTDCQRLEAWYESQTEETLRDLFDRFDAVSPRECWHAFLNDCPSPAQDDSGDSLAAPAEAGHGVCTHLSAAKTVQWILGELFCLAEDGSPEERALLKASMAQDMRVFRLEFGA